jgi:hypothetical protein
MVLVGHEHCNSKCPLLISAFIEECKLLRILIYIQTRVVLVTHEHEIYLKQLIASFLSVRIKQHFEYKLTDVNTCVCVYVSLWFGWHRERTGRKRSIASDIFHVILYGSFRISSRINPIRDVIRKEPYHIMLIIYLNMRKSCSVLWTFSHVINIIENVSFMNSCPLYRGFNYIHYSLYGENKADFHQVISYIQVPFKAD